jgi:Reductase C-terminal
MVPFFWTKHFDLSIRYVGHAEKWDEARVEGDLAHRDGLVRFRRAGRDLAIAAVERDKESRRVGDGSRIQAELVNRQSGRSTRFQPSPFVIPIDSRGQRMASAQEVLARIDQRPQEKLPRRSRGDNRNRAARAKRSPSDLQWLYPNRGVPWPWRDARSDGAAARHQSGRCGLLANATSTSDDQRSLPEELTALRRLPALGGCR